MKKNFTKPSKKIISLLIVVVAIIVGILVVKYRSEHPSPQASLSYQVTDINSYNSAHQTENQSINDLLGIDSSTNQTNSATDTANTSDLVSRSLLSGYLSLSQNGDDSTESKQSLATGIANQAAQSFTYDTYSPDNLKLVSIPNQNDIRFFASSLALIQMNILSGMSKETANSDPNNIKLKNIAAIYKNAAQNLYDLPVPVDIANTVLGVVNNYSVVSSVYAALDNADKDPVSATVAIKYLQDANVSQTAYVNALANYFKDNGIIFTNDEVGRYWNDFGTGTIGGMATSATSTSFQ